MVTPDKCREWMNTMCMFDNRFFLVSIEGGEVSNDHYPFIELLIKDNKIIKKQKYFFDVNKMCILRKLQSYMKIKFTRINIFKINDERVVVRHSDLYFWTLIKLLFIQTIYT